MEACVFKNLALGPAISSTQFLKTRLNHAMILVFKSRKQSPSISHYPEHKSG